MPITPGDRAEAFADEGQHPAGFRQSALDEDRRKFDPYVHALTAEDLDARIVHDGYGFMSFDGMTAIAAGGKLDVALKVPQGVYPRVQQIRIGATNAPVLVELFEGAVTTGGTAVLVGARNRATPLATGVEVLSGVTVTNEGVRIYGFLVTPDAVDERMGTPGEAVIGQGEDIMSILNDDREYVMRITNNAVQPDAAEPPAADSVIINGVPFRAVTTEVLWFVQWFEPRYVQGS